MKDWKNENDYPSAEEKNMRRWAWEFLRRNHEYQKDYAEIAKLINKYGNEWDDHAETPAFSELFVCSPPAHEGEIESQWQRRVLKPGVKAHLMKKDRATCEKYHLTGCEPPDPFMDWPDVASIFWLKGSGLTFHYRNHPETKMLVPPPKAIEEALIRFDLTRPIKPQVERAKQRLEGLQRHAYGKKIDRRHHIRKLRIYLRVLDALDAGASVEEMAAVLYPHVPNDYASGKLASKNLEHDIAKAKEYRDGGYVTLVEK